MAKHFKVDARAVIHLGRENVKDSVTAVLELVKNAYDAGATIVAVHFELNNPDPALRFIRIIDNGSGMTELQIEENWLRIGWSGKRKNPVVDGRVLTGEKGVGRLSADRLGADLVITSKALDEEGVGLHVDWDSFEREDEIGAIDILEVEDPKVDFSVLPEREPREAGPYRQTSGTQLVISKLRQSWTSTELKALREDLRLLSSPFAATDDDDDDDDDEPLVGLANFDIYVSSDMDPDKSGLVEPLPIASKAPLDMSAWVTKTGVLSWRLSSFDPTLGVRTETPPSIPWAKMRLRVGEQLSFLDDAYVAGPMTMRLLFLPRKSEVARNVDLKLQDLRNLLDRSGGIRIYRDGIWLKPYGKPRDPAFDWLGLGVAKASDPAGASRERFRIGPNQLIGAIGITRSSNSDLVDTVGREGLIQNVAFVQLSTIVRLCISMLEAAWTAETREKKKLEPTSGLPRLSPREAVDALSETLKEVRDAFLPLEAVLGDSDGKDVREAREAVQRLVPVAEAAGQAVDEYADQALVLRALASIGIASSVFAHETQNHLAQAGISVDNVLDQLGIQEADLDELKQELGNAAVAIDRLTAWGAFTLGRIARDARVRRRTDFSEVIGSLLDDLEPSFAQIKATIDRKLISISSRIFPSDLESLVLNLVTNAYAACKQQEDRRVRILLESEALDDETWAVLTVGDSGPGVPLSNRENIWEPLFTTKVDTLGRTVGTGLGLSIVRSIVSDLKGVVTVDDDPILGGAMFTVRLLIRKERSS